MHDPDPIRRLARTMLMRASRAHLETLPTLPLPEIAVCLAGGLALMAWLVYWVGAFA